MSALTVKPQLTLIHTRQFQPISSHSFSINTKQPWQRRNIVGYVSLHFLLLPLYFSFFLPSPLFSLPHSSFFLKITSFRRSWMLHVLLRGITINDYVIQVYHHELIKVWLENLMNKSAKRDWCLTERHHDSRATRMLHTFLRTWSLAHLLRLCALGNILCANVPS